MSQIASLTRRMAPLALVGILAVGLGACSQTTRGDFSRPTATATDAPMNLGASAGGSPPAAPPVAAAPANPVNVGTIDASGAVPAKTVKAKKPTEVATPAAPALPSPAEPAVPPAAFASDAKGAAGEPEKVPQVAAKKVRDDGFPNINMPAPEPAGKLLTPEERARVISELEALKNRQGVAPQKAPQKAAPKKCTDDQIAAGEKGCPPPPGN